VKNIKYIILLEREREKHTIIVTTVKQIKKYNKFEYSCAITRKIFSSLCLELISHDVSRHAKPTFGIAPCI